METPVAPAKIKCTINGVEMEVKPGTTIIEAMNAHQQKIAHYCWHPGLPIAGVCRLCMVEIEGNPRLQIACNTTVTEGMKVNNNSPKVQDAVKWGLDFHLINHPLDCPICDQAGECGLQDQYMEYGQYTSEMAEPKQKKSKVVDLGPTVVLDSERCILCSRCVRFTDEVSKTHELGIFNRGDHAEIGTHDGKELNNPYSLNTVDICPVGALTSKDFRFKQRVWYLKDSDTICNGCSTGCNVKVYYNKEGLFRVKPRHNEQVNGYWMCDDGRNVYKFANREHRMTNTYLCHNGEWSVQASAGAFAKDMAKTFSECKDQDTAIVITGQLTNEEYETIFNIYVNKMKLKNIFVWNPFKAQENNFDGLLIRGDKNPNSKGLEATMQKYGIQTEWSQLESKIKSGQLKHLVVYGPENTLVYKDIPEKVKLFSQVPYLIYASSDKSDVVQTSGAKNVVMFPLKTFIEKSGSFTNHAGLIQSFKRATTIINEALTAGELTQLLAGENLTVNILPAVDLMVAANTRKDQVTMEHRKKNEFLFNRKMTINK